MEEENTVNKENNTIEEKIEQAPNKTKNGDELTKKKKNKKEKKWLLKFNEVFYKIFNKDYIPLYTVIAFLLAFSLPYFFTQEWLGNVFKFGTETGPIGDTIGGITSPVIGFFSAILVYFAFRAQIKANKLQMKAIRKQAKDNAFTHEVDLIKYNIEKLTDFMMGDPIPYIIWHKRQTEKDKIVFFYEDTPEWSQNEKLTKLQMKEEPIPSSTKILLRTYFENLHKSSAFKKRVISEENEEDSKRMENDNNFNNIISVLNSQLYAFVYLFNFSIKQHNLLKKDSNGKVDINDPKFHIIYNLFTLIDHTYLNHFSWLWHYTQKDEVYLGAMSDGTPNYKRLVDRVLFVEDFRDKALQVFDSYHDLVKNETEVKEESQKV